jgi:hypothetical protein
MVKIGEELFLGGGRRFRVVAFMPIEDEDTPLTGLLIAAAA